MYNSGDYKLTFDAEMDDQLKAQQQDFMQEDPLAGMIYSFLEDCDYDRVCSKLLYAEALDHPYNQPQTWETREICEIMNTGIASGTIKGWKAYSNPKRYAKYGSQKGWEQVKKPITSDDIQVSVTADSCIDNDMSQYGEQGRSRPVDIPSDSLVDKQITSDDDLPF